jgi:DNA-binding PadR family transcriptional regulator
MADNQRMSANQLHVLGTLDRMCTRGDAWFTKDIAARGIAERAHRSTDGVAYTLQSLIRRELAEIAVYDGDARSYQITKDGRAVMREVRRREAAERQRIQDLYREIQEQGLA